MTDFWLRHVKGNHKQKLRKDIDYVIVLLCSVLLVLFFGLVSSLAFGVYDFNVRVANTRLPNSSSAIQAQRPKRVPSSSMVILVNVHLTAQDDEVFPTSHMQCLGVYTFILTRKSHKMDLVFFHNHKGTLKCAGIDSWHGTGVEFVHITLAWFEARVAALNIDAREYWPDGPQAALVCDFKPLYGHIFHEYIQGYPFWAYGDMDGIFGHTELFNTSLWKYDFISGYCNSNKETRSPTEGRLCKKGYASGPLTIIRNNHITRAVLDYSLDTFWRELFKIPFKKMLDEQVGVHPNLHRILKNETDPVLHHKTLPFSNLKQYCHDSCKLVKLTKDIIVFNLVKKATDKESLKFRWTKNGGTWVWANGKRLYRIHFLHWSLWKYEYGPELDAFIAKLYWNIRDLDCFELFTKPLHLEICSDTYSND